MVINKTIRLLSEFISNAGLQPADANLVIIPQAAASDPFCLLYMLHFCFLIQN
jgi:hypothetical protein